MTAIKPPPSALRVTSLTITSAPYKSHDSSGRACFAVDGQFSLSDGTTCKTRVTADRKKDLPDRIARRQDHAQRGHITIENGFEVIRFTIG